MFTFGSEGPGVEARAAVVTAELVLELREQLGVVQSRVAEGEWLVARSELVEAAQMLAALDEVVLDWAIAAKGVG